MKKYFLFLFAFANIFAGDKVYVEIRGGYFYPTSSVIEQVYNNGGAIPEVELSIDISKIFRVWLNFNTFLKTGYTVLENSPNLQLYELSCGLKKDLKIIDPVFFYLGIGPCFAWLFEQPNSQYLPSSLSGYSFGFVAKSGFIWKFKRSLFLDLFADYSYNTMYGIFFAGNSQTLIDVGGLRGGLGFGGRF
jgi:hypothetical protein